MKRVAKMLRRHHELILNWFRAKGTISSGVVEGLNYNAKLTMKKAIPGTIKMPTFMAET